MNKTKIKKTKDYEYEISEKRKEEYIRDSEELEKQYTAGKVKSYKNTKDLLKALRNK